MSLFAPENRTLSPRHKTLYAAYEIAYTLADFAAAMLFLVGSVLFFYQSLETPAIWCFVFGSALFAVKPTLRLARELHYAAIGDTDDLARRAGA
ncbi:YrhK family protein [Aquibium sp. A9E412]|uniref:YrhK family protein n=1 Tax=Aquibium sp. A9E412 TaxID=2976767 RepID=UPI0025B02564|nr:YrhK family protein [Aquibium sp. A9E412]MDN2567204.1 YrhK family protein [Aquibium sp. A9E412]